MALNPVQLNSINQNLSADRAIKAQFLSNPAFTGLNGISSNLSGSTLGGVGLDTLAGMGVIGIGGSSDAQLQAQLRKTDDLFNIGLSMSAPGSLAQNLAQKAVATSQQQSQTSLLQLVQQQQTLAQQIALQQRLGLPVPQQAQLQLFQIQQQMQQVMLQQQSFQANFLGAGSSSAAAAGLGLGGSRPDLGTLGLGLQGVSSLASSPFTTGILGSGGLNTAASPTSPLAQVFGGMGAGTGYGGVPIFPQQQQQPRYVMVVPGGYPQQQAVYAQQPQFMQSGYPQQGQQQGFLMLPPMILRPQ